MAKTGESDTNMDVSFRNDSDELKAKALLRLDVL